MAIAVAEAARERAERPQVERMAEAVINAQSAEVNELNAIHEDLFGTSVENADHGSLALPVGEMGAAQQLPPVQVLGMLSGVGGPSPGARCN